MIVEQRLRTGESPHLLPIWPGFDSGPESIPARCHLWVAFVIGSRLAPRVFLRILRLSSQLHLPITSPNSNSTGIEDLYEIQLRPMWLPL